MKFFPYDNYIPVTSRSVDDVMQKIYGKLGRPELTGIESFWNKDPKPYHGSISENSFSMRRIGRSGGGYFLPQ